MLHRKIRPGQGKRHTARRRDVLKVGREGLTDRSFELRQEGSDTRVSHSDLRVFILDASPAWDTLPPESPMAESLTSFKFLCFILPSW